MLPTQLVFFFFSQFIKFLREKSVIVQLRGKQVADRKPVNMAAKKGKDTKTIMRAETLKTTVSSSVRVVRLHAQLTFCCRLTVVYVREVMRIMDTIAQHELRW